jgi:hypothetical protein
MNMKKEWLFDTCASYHMTANRDSFVSYRPADKNQGICDAQGSRGRPLGKGTVIVKTSDGGILKLEDVLHIPTLHANLISGALLEEQGFQVEKSTSIYTIYTPDGDMVTASVVPGVNIYRIDRDKGY